MYRKHKANTGKEMATMAVVEFALGKLLWHDRLHAEMREKAANQTSFSPCTEPLRRCWRDTNNSCKIAFLRGTGRNTKPLSPSTY